jgi:hypothetical protein
MTGLPLPSATDLVGYVAITLVLASASMRSILLLRMVAVASSFAFILYGALGEIYPVLLLHLFLLPLNLIRIGELLAVRAADAGRPWSPSTRLARRGLPVLGAAPRRARGASTEVP